MIERPCVYLARLGSNQDYQYQKLGCYHYTTGQGPPKALKV